MYLLRQLHKVRNSQEWRLCQFQKSFSELYKLQLRNKVLRGLRINQKLAFDLRGAAAERRA